ncbi:MAG: hypothetical protein K2Q17_06870 [Nitrospiraceae bacterium]|jgi:hypothetical protein|uniref:hypothetical protein n=1 Tax=Nitrospira cf. moscoviensis SBR1015 TaxID=96242 RepID=UPI000A0AC74E|nr:hypothetical protein [Nitrospira cf. moscoviensis SBR1015]MBY0247372.1 hypothetical protein [Nitrospiraceae bacterium]OQW36439.1 MAG: hypothetical protein A4E20_08115 [Nitrospira sp. SG-bin2]
MSKVKRHSLQLALSVITFVLVVGSLSMVWPAIIALFFGAVLLFQSCCLEEMIAMLSWAEIGDMPIVASFRRPGLPAMLA